MSSTQGKPTIAFFGATGGCGLAALARSLEAGLECTALVRTPSKLLSLLSARNTPTTTLSIITGSIHDASAVRRTLIRPSNTETNTSDNETIDIIITTIGGTPRFQASLLKPVTLDDPTICATGTKTILDTLHTLQAEAKNPAEGKLRKPLLIAVSTTGIEPRQRDVPLLFVPLYHWLLAVPHADKKAMEDALQGQFSHPSPSTSTSSNVISGALIIRPSLLLDGPAAPLWKNGDTKGLRVGVGAGKGVVGYTVTRESVGAWIHEEVVRWKGGGDEPAGDGGWEEQRGGCEFVTLTE